jgi:hypothetical protein
MRLKLERSDERLTRRTGLILINRFGDEINLASSIDRAFREPGSHRGFDASDYVLPLSEMIIWLLPPLETSTVNNSAMPFLKSHD